MGARDPAEAVEVLDLLLKFFGDGERWVRGRLSDRRGNRCLVGALDFVSSHHGMKGDAAERYLADEISPAAACNDAGGDCARFRASPHRPHLIAEFSGVARGRLVCHHSRHDDPMPRCLSRSRGRVLANPGTTTGSRRATACTGSISLRVTGRKLFS